MPPFDSLLAFDAVSRRLSMTSAAEELCLTQGAVSHRIKKLEEFMGVALFIRGSTQLRLTPAGLALQTEVQDIIGSMAKLKERAIAAASPETLRVGIGAALAENWLIRRLPAFNEQFPEITIELVVLENEAPEREPELDLKLLWVDVSEAHKDGSQFPLFREHVFPVCSPDLLRSAVGSSGPDVLRNLPLLEKNVPGYPAGEEWKWNHWFERLNLGEPPKAALSFSSIGPVVSAAIQGTGVGLARSMLVCDALEDGRLVRVLAAEHDLLSSKVHVLRWGKAGKASGPVKEFAEWLQTEAIRTALYVDPVRTESPN